MAHDVFISYAIEDRRTAESVCEALEKSGITCWYAPRDIPFGVDYEEAIVDGICNSRLVVLILSKYSNSSPHVRREIQNASAEENARPILPVRVDGVQLNKALRYYLSSAQWLDASAPPLENHLQRLVQQLRSRLPPTGTKPDAGPITTHQSSVTPPVTPPVTAPVTKDTQPQRPEEDSTERQGDNVATPTTPVISSKNSMWIMFGGLGILLFIGVILIVLFADLGQDADETDTSTAATSATGTPTPATSATAALTPTTSATATVTPTAPATATPTPGQTQAELEQACFNLVQGQIAWNYTGSKTWSPENIQNLCRRTTQPSEPPACFHRVMHGGINNGKSTKWVWQDALKLCTGTNNADKTISCFTMKLAENIEASAAIDACHR